jgi:hypothetical protein
MQPSTTDLIWLEQPALPVPPLKQVQLLISARSNHPARRMANSRHQTSPSTILVKRSGRPLGRARPLNFTESFITRLKALTVH